MAEWSKALLSLSLTIARFRFPAGPCKGSINKKWSSTRKARFSLTFGRKGDVNRDSWNRTRMCHRLSTHFGILLKSRSVSVHTIRFLMETRDAYVHISSKEIDYGTACFYLAPDSF